MWFGKGKQQPSRFAREAEEFVRIMGELAPALRLDYSLASVAALEQFIAQTFDPPGSKFVGESLPVGVGCYLGEVQGTRQGRSDPVIYSSTTETVPSPPLAT